MDILDWIMQKRPGSIQDLGDHIEISHESGEYSTLWKRVNDTCPASLHILGPIYSSYNGMDLFSSTFKIAASDSPKGKNGVAIVFSLGELREEVSAIGCEFPKNSVPFLYQAGIGYGAVDVDTGAIYECDTDGGAVCDEYASIADLMDDWLAAIS